MAERPFPLVETIMLPQAPTFAAAKRTCHFLTTLSQICFDNVCCLRYLNFVNSLAHHHHHHHHAHGASAGVFG